MKSYLEFEREVKVLEEELEKLKDPFNKEGISEVNTQQISKIQDEINNKLKTSYANLDAIDSCPSKIYFFAIFPYIILYI